MMGLNVCRSSKTDRSDFQEISTRLGGIARRESARFPPSLELARARSRVWEGGSGRSSDPGRRRGPGGPRFTHSSRATARQRGTPSGRGGHRMSAREDPDTVRSKSRLRCPRSRTHRQSIRLSTPRRSTRATCRAVPRWQAGPAWAEPRCSTSSGPWATQQSARCSGSGSSRGRPRWRTLKWKGRKRSSRRSARRRPPRPGCRARLRRGQVRDLVDRRCLRRF